MRRTAHSNCAAWPPTTRNSPARRGLVTTGPPCASRPRLPPARRCLRAVTVRLTRPSTLWATSCLRHAAGRALPYLSTHGAPIRFIPVKTASSRRRTILVSAIAGLGAVALRTPELYPPPVSGARTAPVACISSTKLIGKLDKIPGSVRVRAATSWFGRCFIGCWRMVCFGSARRPKRHVPPPGPDFPGRTATQALAAKEGVLEPTMPVRFPALTSKPSKSSA